MIIYELKEVKPIQNSPDSSGWIIALAIDWLFAECIAKMQGILEMPSING